MELNPQTLLPLTLSLGTAAPRAQAIGQFAMVIGVGIGILINCIFVFIALKITKLRASFGGMLAISAAQALPQFFLPLAFGWAVSLLCVAFVVRSVTEAEDWIPSLKYLGVSFLISIVLTILLMLLVVGSLDFSKLQKLRQPSDSAPQIEQEESEGTTTTRPTPSNAYDALKGKLSPEEIAEIEKQMSEAAPHH